MYQLKKLLHDVVQELESYGLTTDVVEGLFHDSDDPHSKDPNCYSGMVVSSTPDVEPTEKANAAASRWISTLPRDERFLSTRRIKRTKSLGSIKLVAHRSENSPNTFFLSSDAVYKDSHLRKSPRRNSEHNIHWSPSDKPNLVAQLPPLTLSRSTPLGDTSDQDLNDRNKQAVNASLEQGPKWMKLKAPELLPDDSSSYAGSCYGNLDPSKSNEPHWVESKSGRRVWAKYQLFNDSLSLCPQLVLIVQSPNVMKPSNSPLTVTVSPEAEVLDSDPSTPQPAASSGSPQNSRRAQRRIDSLDLGPAAQELPNLSAEELLRSDVDEPIAGYHQRKLVIPLLSDEHFFQSLIKAIRNLLQLHIIQQNTLIRHVNALCDAITEVASPVHTRQDMYAWREIFALWVEFDIFESSREKDRGELSVAATEARFHNYLEQLERRGFLFPHHSEVMKGAWLSSTLDSWALQAFAPNNPLQDPRSIGTLEHFLRLNVALVSLKRFQRLNIETIRKIIKKHHKKTALSASTSIGQMVTLPAAHQLIRAASMDSPMPELDWDKASAGDILKSLAALAPVNERSSVQLSLPRIMASLLTNALLPILPSVDDYSCLVCMSIAWHPIRLRCGHLFCIRCLVKLQKRGDNHCPLCRAENAVKDADENNFDVDMAKYLQEWFPREVEEKTQENKSDRLVQDRQEKELRRKKNLLSKFRLRRHGDGDADCVIA